MFKLKDVKVNDIQSLSHTTWNCKYHIGIKIINGREYVNLCLYYPSEWNSTMNISDTIIPWISEWLYYFEFWCITGEWYGGGKHPTKKDIKENDKNWILSFIVFIKPQDCLGIR